MSWLSRLADALVPTGPILDPEDCLDTEPVDVCCDTCGASCQFASGGPGVGAGCDRWEPAKMPPPPVRVERWCVGEGGAFCLPWTEHWTCDDFDCDACHWTPCGEVGGCSPIGVTPTDRCSGRWRDVFAGNDMARPNYAPWPNPCAREV